MGGLWIIGLRPQNSHVICSDAPIPHVSYPELRPDFYLSYDNNAFCTISLSLLNPLKKIHVFVSYAASKGISYKKTTALKS
jgi:hypothetical protein